MRPQKITITINENLSSASDQQLALYWHVAQANPAPHGDYHAGALAKRVGSEIIRRWMAQAPIEMYHHQADHNYALELRKFAKYIPGCRDGNISSKFHDGEWVANADFDARKAEVEAAQLDAATLTADDMALYIGQTVAIVNKQVVAAADDWPALLKHLRENGIDADGCQTITEIGVKIRREAEHRARSDGRSGGEPTKNGGPVRPAGA